MSFCVSFRLFLDGFLEFFGQIDACLVGQTEQYPQHIGHLFTQCLPCRCRPFWGPIPSTTVRHIDD